MKTECARLLGVKTSALYYKLEKYGIGVIASRGAGEVAADAQPPEPAPEELLGDGPPPPGASGRAGATTEAATPPSGRAADRDGDHGRGR